MTMLHRCPASCLHQFWRGDRGDGSERGSAAKSRRERSQPSGFTTPPAQRTITSAQLCERRMGSHERLDGLESNRGCWCGRRGRRYGAKPASPPRNSSLQHHNPPTSTLITKGTPRASSAPSNTPQNTTASSLPLPHRRHTPDGRKKAPAPPPGSQRPTIGESQLPNPDECGPAKLSSPCEVCLLACIRRG